MSSESDIPDNANEGCVGAGSKLAGKSSACQGCPNQAACASGANAGPDPALGQVAERLSEVKHKILVLSGKGGVGKSTVSSQIAWSLAALGFQVGILDIDICGPSVPRMMGVEREEVRRSNLGWSPVYVPGADNLAVMSVAFMLSSRDDAIIWRGPRKDGLIKQFLTEVYWGDLDFLIVDAPPGTSDEHISIAHYLKAATSEDDSGIDGALIVTTPQEVALLDVRKEINFCKKVGINVLGLVENMSGFVCPCCSTKSDIFPATTGGARSVSESMHVPMLGCIPMDPKLFACCEQGQCYLTTHPNASSGSSFKDMLKNMLTSTPSLRKTSENVIANFDKLLEQAILEKKKSENASSSA